MTKFTLKSILCAATALAFVGGAGLAQAQNAATASEPATKIQITLADGEQREIFGTRYEASGATEALAVLSSEFATVAVVNGALSVDDLTAQPGQALVTPITSRKTERFVFDAMRLFATLRPEWVAGVGPQLDALAKAQKRKRFWGMLEPTGVNASAPGSGLVEAIRSTYLSDPVIVDVRVRAQGDSGKRRRLTAEAFAAALAAGDGTTVAALLDPKPFTDVSLDPQVWRSARVGFAARILADGVVRANAGTPPVASPDPLTFALGAGFTLRLIDRDRATFVAALEPTS